MVDIRAIAIGDAERLRAFDARLSERSRQLRYHGWMPPLTAERARVLAHTGSAHCALVATTSGATARIVADCRVSVIPDLPDTGELAIAVADDFQGVGLGRALLERTLAGAAGRGLATVLADVREDNVPMARLLTDLGFVRT